jgi:hypothetical protein
VDGNVDNSRFPVEEMWITHELSTASSCPQNYPQTYPQILPLLSTGLSTTHIAIWRYISIIYDDSDIFIHIYGDVSTVFVDKCWFSRPRGGKLSTRRRRRCGRFVDKFY